MSLTLVSHLLFAISTAAKYLNLETFGDSVGDSVVMEKFPEGEFFRSMFRFMRFVHVATLGRVTVLEYVLGTVRRIRSEI
jgi:predicted transcriptional regulator